jgi:hypothetical protein
MANIGATPASQFRRKRLGNMVRPSEARDSDIDRALLIDSGFAVRSSPHYRFQDLKMNDAQCAKFRHNCRDFPAIALCAIDLILVADRAWPAGSTVKRL